MASFAPEGYSGSSESLSNASALSKGVVSTTLFSSSCSECCPGEARNKVLSFSIRLVDVCWLEGMIAEVGGSVSMLRGAVGFVRERVGNFMVNSRVGGIEERLNGWGEF